MAGLKVLVFSLAVTLVLGEEQLLQPCAAKDRECLKSSTKMFMEKTAPGIPKFGVKPVDPFFASLICVTLPDDVMLHYHNVTVKGLKDCEIEHFEIDKENKKVMLATKEDVDISADLIVELLDVKKSFPGSYNAKATTRSVFNYNYSILTDDKGEHFDVGPETITVEVLSPPQVTLAPHLEQALESDPDVSKKDKSQLTEIRKKSVQTILEPALHDMVHNIRACARILPRNAFFTDV